MIRTYTPHDSTPPPEIGDLIDSLREVFENKTLPESTRSRAVNFLKYPSPSQRGKDWQFEVQSFLLTQRNFSNFNSK
jgi:hypothetical protein